MSIPYRTRNRIKRFALVLLVLCIAGMMSSTYSSFLYFQF